VNLKLFFQEMGMKIFLSHMLVLFLLLSVTIGSENHILFRHLKL